ncbi:hypothetical protein ACFQ34_00255 [Pseudonocardia benzenivorans]|uniref:HEPN AbiU2-like domain-containing protein n=1 Tax=Pseudonocardia benzenivorans TaxID=228005 RepID=A0ABW3VCG5_9PSEU
MKIRPTYMKDRALEQLEVVAVQLDECRRLIEQGTVPHLRIALILADNAAELIMRRQVIMTLEYNHLWTKYPEFLELPPEHEARVGIQNIAGEYVDQKRLKRIDQHFPEKVKLLVERGVVDQGLGAGLNKLHDYRNEAQHDDKVREATLGPAVRIYFDMACALLAGYKPKVLYHRAFIMPGESETDWLTEHYPTVAAIRAANPAWRREDEEAVATYFRASIALDDLDTLRQALEEHLLSRVDEIEKELEWTRGALKLFDGWKPADMLRMAQELEEMDKHDQFRSLEQMRSRANKYRYKLPDLDRWRSEIAGLDELRDRTSLFAEFARIEDDLEPCHEAVMLLMMEVDHMVEEIDNYVRGK